MPDVQILENLTYLNMKIRSKYMFNNLVVYEPLCQMMTNPENVKIIQVNSPAKISTMVQNLV